MTRFAPLMLGLLATGCTTHTTIQRGGPELGELEVSWRVGTSTCTDAGVHTIGATLDGQEEETLFPCSDGSGILPRLEPGNYELQLVGRDADGIPRFASTPEKVRVDSGVSDTLPTMLLGALPASITTTWYFDNGRMCGHNGVDTVEITLFDDDYLVTTEPADCAEGLFELTDVRAGGYQINVMGRDSEGRAVFNGSAQVELGIGDHHTVEVALVSL
jgi:hypothetical protein